MLYAENYDILLVCETWLNAGISSGLLDPESYYYVLRNDRSKSDTGGGVCAFVSRKLRIVEVDVDARFSSLELLGFDLLCSDSKIRFFVVYRPPYRDLQYLQLLIECLTVYTDCIQTNVITGDFNFPSIDWVALNSPDDCINRPFLDFAIERGFCQCVDFATRGGHVLDIVLTDDDELMTAVKPEEPIGNSDHLIVQFSMSLRLRSAIDAGRTSNELNWAKADFDAMNLHLSNYDWQSLLLYNPNALSLWSGFVTVMRTAIERYVPRFKCLKAGRKTKRTLYPPQLRKLRAQKCRIWRQLRHNPCDDSARTQYKACVREWKMQTRECDRRAEMHVIESNNLGSFYKYVNRRISYRSGIGALIDGAGNVVECDEEKANIFNKYFASVGTVDNNVLPSCRKVVSGNTTLATIEFSSSNVKQAINKLRPNLSSGPDGLPPLLFKRLKHCLAGPLAMIYTQMLSVAAVPDEWKQAIITPVFKKGAAGCVSNYRPISLTCVASKIMERVIAHQMYSYFSDNCILHKAQHGFVKGHSTCTNLLESMNDWTRSLSGRRGVTVAYIDFSRAFDSVSQKKLIESRLTSYGIAGNLLDWLRNFLCGRTHQTKVGSALSEIANLLSGVIQGSGIGPLMFLAYINDLIEIMEKSGVIIKLFADDAKVYIEIVDIEDVEKLQRALNLLVEWAAVWQLKIAINKCFVLNIGKIPQSVLALDTSYCIDNCVLPIVSSCRDLGVVVSHDLSPREHINAIVLKAQQRANLILRCFVCNDTSVLLRAYLTYVRPILEYNSVVWSPNLKCEIDALERVQRRFTKRLRGMNALSYTERLAKLELLTLELRRLHNDLVVCYRIVFGLIDLPLGDFFTLNQTGSTRGHRFKLYKPRVDGARNVFFCNRVINVWNSLPVDIVDFGSLNKFKRTIMRADFSMYLKASMF